MKKATYVLLVHILFFTQAVQAQPQTQNRPPAQVIATKVQIQEFSDSVEAIGTLKANESVVLTATVTEKVTEVNFEDNQRVEAGDILVEMTSEQEKAELNGEQATAAEAKRQLERVRPLVETGAASKSILDQRQREYDTAKARLEGVRSQIGDRVITAPFSGVLGLRNISVGAVVQPGMRITTLDDDSIMKMDFSVPSLFLTALKPGLEIAATSPAFEGEIFKGKISSIDSQIDPLTRSIMVRAVIPNEALVLKPGLLMNVEIFKNPRSAIVVPEEAMISEGKKNFVFVVAGSGQEAKAEKREIFIGTRKPGFIEVVKGLKEGELVITEGMNAAPGASVQVRAIDKGGEELQELLKQEGK